MNTTKTTTTAMQPAPSIDKLYIENTLLRVAGSLFCHDRRAIRKTEGEEIEINPGVAEKLIVIRPDPEFGQPGPLAHKIFVALIKKHSDYGRPVPSEVSFTKRELMRLVGRHTWGGATGDELVRALNQIHHTFIRTRFKTREGKHVEHSFAIFPEIYLERTEGPADPVESCVVTLARPIVASLEDDHFTCLNHARMLRLGTIGQALMMRLFFHFANLFDGQQRSRLSFLKRYDAICIEWLGGLKVLPHRSMIERDQLGPHLRQLVSEGFLMSYSITKARRGEGLVITFRPGPEFFFDYDRFYRHRRQGGLQFDFHGERQSVAEPVKVAYLFLEKRTGRKLSAIPYVSSKEVETAKELLRNVSFEAIGPFLDYAFTEAERTRFEVQTLGGVRQYVTGFLAKKAKRAESDAAIGSRQVEQREVAVRADYASFCRERADRIFAELPAAEQALIEKLAMAKAQAPVRAAGATSISTLMLGMARARITAERHPESIPSFEIWRWERRIVA